MQVSLQYSGSYLPKRQFEFVADILTDDQALGGDRYFIIADSTGATGLCMLSSSSITEWRFMNGDSTATSDPEYVGAIDPATSGGFDVFHQFRVRVRKLTASSSSVEVYVDGTLKLTATAGAALITCAKIGFIGGVTGSPSTSDLSVELPVVLQRPPVFKTPMYTTLVAENW